MLAKVKDYPFLGTVMIGVVVVAHRLLYYQFALFPDVAGSMAEFQEAWSVYVGFGAVVAIAAGFTSVVVVFALSSESRPFRTLRLDGGARLEANWLSPVAAALVAAFGSFVCAILAISGHPFAAWWLFEFVILLAAVSSIRLMWLFKALVRVVRANDEQVAAAENAPVTLDTVRRRASRRQSGT